MDGFVRQARRGLATGCLASTPTRRSARSARAHPDVMGYHDAREIPNYWAYARNFVLQDHMFQPDTSWSLPAHLFMVSEWSARCRTHATAELRERDREPARAAARAAEPDRPQARLRLDRSHLPAAQAPRLVALLRRQGRAARLRRRRGMVCKPVKQSAGTPGIWNPLPWFDTVQGRPRAAQHRPDEAAVHVAKRGTLPAVSWVIPSNRVSEHPPSLVTAGQAFVTSVVNAVMRSPRLELDRDLPRLGRLGRLLRPRRAAAGRRERLRPARARPRDLALRHAAGTSTTRC